MKTRWTFHGCDDQSKAEVQAYWAKKAPRLERMLGRFPDERRELNLYLHWHPSLQRYEGRLILHLPTGVLVAEESEAGVRPLLDQLADFLVASVKRHKEKLRRDWSYRRRNRQGEDVVVVEQPLEFVGYSIPAFDGTSHRSLPAAG